MNNQPNPTNVTTGDVRLSYAHIFTPYAHEQGKEPKYSVTMLIPKTDIATKQRIDAAINAAIQQGVSGKWNGTRPPQVKTLVWDGDGVRQNGEAFGSECKGHWVITASSNQQPSVFDLALNPIINQTEVYSGMYAQVNVNFTPYFNSGNKGVGCYLNMIQKRTDGEPLAGNKVSAEEAFGGVPAQGTQQPQQGYAPPVQQGYAQPVQQQGYAQPMPQPVQQPIQQQGYAQPVQQQLDPITGKPITGGVMGI